MTSFWCNCTCGGKAACFYQLNNSGNSSGDVKQREYYWTAGLNFALFGVCLVSVIATSFKFNSIHVLNLRYRPTAISNVLWVFYFICLGIRCLMLAVFYVYFRDHPFNYDDHVIPKALFPTENVFRILEILFLTLTLEYQRKHRSKGFIQDVMEKFNQPSCEETKTINCTYVCKKLFCSTYSIFISQALISFTFLAATSVFVLREGSDKVTAALYWTYNGCLWTMSISCVVLTAFILCASTIDETFENKGPSVITKVILAVGIVLSLSGNIPVFIWQKCIFKATPAVSGYYIVVPLMFAAVCLFMAVLIQEFIRLKEEAQWSVIDQSESNYSITESI